MRKILCVGFYCWYFLQAFAMAYSNLFKFLSYLNRKKLWCFVSCLLFFIRVNFFCANSRNTLIWPVSHCIEMTSFEFNWNNKYPGKYPLVPIEDKWIEKDEINLHRTGNVSCLPFKKRWLDISATNGNNFNELLYNY
jgi:hypothetical protein